MTPREFAALKRVWEAERTHANTLYAAIQATLHNAWMRNPQQHPQPFSIADFLPGGSSPDKPFGSQTAAQKRLIMGAMIGAAKARFQRKIGKG